MKTAKHEVLVKFGMALRMIRTSLNFSQEDLADKCELDRTYIGGIERGERNLSLINIYKVCAALNVKPEKLFDEAGKQ